MSAPGAGRPAVDWTDLKRKVQAANDSASGGAMDPQRQRQILTQRAQALARQAQPAPAAAPLSLVTFSVQGEALGAAAHLVWDVFRLVEFTPLPGATAPVVGITAWRGSILALLDLPSVLGMPVGAVADHHYGLVVGQQRPELGLLADALGELVALDPGQLREPPEGVARHRQYVQGVTPAALLVLDIPRLLRDTVERGS